MQIQHFLVVYAECLQRVVQVKELLLCEKVCIVGCVNALGSSKDTVCCRKATPQLRAVLDVIDPEKLSFFPQNKGLLVRGHTGEKRYEAFLLLDR